LNILCRFNKLDKNRIGLAGSSFGGFHAALVSLDYDFKSIALIVPAAYSPSLMNMPLIDDQHVSRMEKDFEKSESYQKIAKFKISC